MLFNPDRPTPWHQHLLRTCAIAALVLGFGTTSHAAEPATLFPAPVYVTLQGSSQVEILPSGKNCDGLPGAHYVAVSPDGSRMLVSSANKPEAYLVDTHDCRKLATFDVGPVTQGVQISPDGHWGLAVSAGNGTVTIIDLHAAKAVATIPVGKTPHNARFTANSKLAYVTLQGAGAVATVDLQTLKKTGGFPVPGLPHPHNLGLSANGKVLWIRGLVAKVAAVDLTTHKVLAVIPVGLGHGGIDVVPSGRWVYAGVTGTNKIAVIDTKTLEVVKQVPVSGTIPFWVAVAGHD